MDNLFSVRIKELRQSSNQTQVQFAQSIGTTQAALSGYENGDRVPSYEILVSLAKTYNVSIDWLCGLSDIRNPANNFTTYRDVFQVLANICVTKYENGKSTLLFPTFSDGMPDTLFVASEDPHFYSFFNEYEKMYELYIAGTIDEEVYKFWLRKELAKYDFSLDKSIHTIDNK